jgi:hypothetical protein
MKEKMTERIKRYAFRLILALTFVYLVGHNPL